MAKIFIDANEKYVGAIVVYGKTADKKLYTTSAYETQVDQADVENAFKKGILLVDDGTNLLAPVALKDNKVTTVAVASNAVAGTEWAAKATV